VVKVERHSGDDTRKWGPPYFTKPDGSKMSTYFISTNKDKKSIALDLKDEASINVVKDLAKVSDVLVENFLPGTMSKLGLDFENIKKINPSIIYCSMTGYGQDGPYVDEKRGGYDMIASSIGGFMSITGTQEQPIRPGVAITDISMALYAHGAIMAAMLDQQNGKSDARHLKIDLLGTQLAINSYATSSWLNGQSVAKRWGTGHPSIVPYQSFICKDGKWLSVAVGNDEQYRKFLDKLQEVADISCLRTFQTNAERVKDRKMIIDKISTVFKTMNRNSWIDLFKDSGFPYGSLNDMNEVFNDPQVKHKNLISTTQSGMKFIDNPISTNIATPKITPADPPEVGEHTREILQDILGYDQNRIDSLTKKN